MCLIPDPGGYSASVGEVLSSCYQLQHSAWVTSEPLLVGRLSAASVVLHNGSVLVTGGRTGVSVNDKHQSSDILTATGWSAGIRLPSARYGHCMLQLSSGELFLHGGNTDTGDVGDTYISSDMTTWTKKMSSKTRRKYHACTEREHAGYICVGGHGTTEIYSVKTNSWTATLDLPDSGYQGQFISYNRVLIYAAGGLIIYQLNAHEDGWIKVLNLVNIFIIP